MATFNISNLFSVQGQVCVITGGGSGLGEAMALALAENGASKVFILGRRQASLEKVATKAVRTPVFYFHYYFKALEYANDHCLC